MLQDLKIVEVNTPYGEVELQEGSLNDLELVFCLVMEVGIRYHHRINYRANIWALKSIGVTRIIATNAVGSTNRLMRPGDLVIVDQFLDFTKSRVHTFFDGEDTPVIHTDMTDPYCPELRLTFLKVAQDKGIKLHSRGCYACFEGPRYESAAEIRMVSILGGDLVGMTGVPEVVLAREAGICYASIAMVTNMGAGIAATPLSHEEVVEVMEKNEAQLRELLLHSLNEIPKNFSCACSKDKQPLIG